MSAHLLLVTLGPVQEFIAQARRSRDLWCGSQLLSELSKAVARVLAEAGAELVFPALPRHDPCLEPWGAPPSRPNQPFNVANKILVWLPPEASPPALVEQCRAALWQRLAAEADPLRTKLKDLLASDVEAVWREQLATLPELYAAWVSLEQAGGYAPARQQLELALAGRKNLRDFDAWHQQRGDVPKSSLDGGRATVLAEPDRRDPRLAARFRIPRGEQLDAVGLLKRCGGRPDQFVPLANVALADWIGRAQKKAPAELAKLAQACAALDLEPIHRRDLRWLQPFAYDAQLFLPARWPELLEECGYHGPATEWGRNHVQPILRQLPEPYPYLACLVADGDHLGRTLEALTEPDQHREFSRRLARFAARAKEIVERHRGLLIYSGGDDVLAFIGLADALQCAADLRRAFTTLMQEALAGLGPELPCPTLSVGLGVGHLLEAMSYLLELGRHAERAAKAGHLAKVGLDRDALAIRLDKRAGGVTTWRSRWGADPVTRLEQDVQLLRQQRLSSKKIYQIRAILQRLPAPASLQEGTHPDWARLLQLEVARTLARSGLGAPGAAAATARLEPVEAGLGYQANASYQETHRQTADWVERLLIARTVERSRVAEE